MPDERKIRPRLNLDADRLGMLGGAFLGTIVLGASLFIVRVDLPEALFRAGIAFVVTYGALFCFIRILLRTTLFEFLEAKKSALKKAAQRLPEQSSDEAGREGE